MSKKLTKNQSTTALLKDRSAKNGKKLIKRVLKAKGFMSEREFEETFDLMLDSKKGGKKGRRAKEKLEGDFGQSMANALNLDTKTLTSQCVTAQYTPFLLEMIEELEREYSVKTATEKAIVQTAALSFVQFLRYSSLFNANAPGKWGPDNQFLSAISKEADRAYRRFNSSTQLLKQMKEPPLKVSLKAKNAFVSQNQQFNQQIQNEERS